MRSRALYTPPVTPRKLVLPEADELTTEAVVYGRPDDWGEVVTREPAAGSPPLRAFHSFFNYDTQGYLCGLYETLQNRPHVKAVGCFSKGKLFCHSR